MYNHNIIFYYLDTLVISKKAIESEHIKEKVWKLLDSLEIQYSDISLFILAFIHRSIVNERADYTPEHNERLEFLWDAVLELIITHKLYEDHPEMSEGEMTDIRSALVRGRNLSEISKKLWFREYLLLWKGEEKWGGRDNDYILANTYESFLWAIYLDCGYIVAEKFVIQTAYSTLSNIVENKLFKDFKTLLQEYTQSVNDITPHYTDLSETWPDHDKIYTVWVYLKENQIWEWKWSSKKKAQEDAAQNAYIKINP